MCFNREVGQKTILVYYCHLEIHTQFWAGRWGFASASPLTSVGAEMGLWPLQRPISGELINVTGLPGKRSSDLLCLPIFTMQTLPSRQLQATDSMSPRAGWRQHVHSWLRLASTSTLLDPEWSDWWPGMGQCLLYDSLRHERTEFYNILSFYFKENGFIHL